jgi:hypothetical protein
MSKASQIGTVHPFFEAGPSCLRVGTTAGDARPGSPGVI